MVCFSHSPSFFWVKQNNIGIGVFGQGSFLRIMPEEFCRLRGDNINEPLEGKLPFYYALRIEDV